MEQNNEVLNIRKKKYKLHKRKKFIAYLLTATTLLGAGYTFYIRKTNEKRNSNKDYAIGYEDIGIFNQISNRVTDNNFILLDIGDHNSIGNFFQKQKLDYCQENGIDIGLLLNTNSSNLSDIYYDLEYIMGILEKYQITYPIYLNVDNILENETLTLDQAIILIDSFLKKAEANNIYVGIYGKKENILEKYFEKDILMLNSSEKKGSIVQKNGVYYADLGLKNDINEISYNNPKCFKQDEYHILKEGETLNTVARQYGISVQDLKKYNNILLDFTKTGDVLRIPSLVLNHNHHLNKNGEFAKLGIDVSLWQNEINWQEVEIEYAIIQVRDFINEENDPQFENNVNGCLQNNIPMGFYIFSRATTKEEVQEEAKYLISQIKGLPVDYPVYLDLETNLWQSLDETGRLNKKNYNIEETKEFVLEFIKTWEREILKAGYIPGIYCNYSLYNNLNLATDQYLENMQCWIAGGTYYSEEITHTTNEELPIINLEENEKIAMKQFTSMGTIKGISSYVDLNYCYTDYEQNYDWERTEITKSENKLLLGLGITGLLLSGSLFTVKKKNNKKKIKSRNNKSIE